MKATEFCYWLQGHFEIGQMNAPCITETGLNAMAVDCIRRHLHLVNKVDGEHDNVFLVWLELRLSGAGSIDKAGVAQIKRYLARQFKREIDPSYGGDAKELQAAHDGSGVPHGPLGLIARC